MKKNKEIILLANAAVSKGDYEGFLVYCTEDTKWTFIGDTEISGKAAVLNYMKEIYLEPPLFDVELLIAEDNYVVTKGTIKLLEKNKQYKQYTYCDIWKFRNGKMAELQAFVIDK